jgi:hypothetical protein
VVWTGTPQQPDDIVDQPGDRPSPGIVGVMPAAGAVVVRVRCRPVFVSVGIGVSEGKRVTVGVLTLAPRRFRAIVGDRL